MKDFEIKWIKKIEKELLKKFPDEFIQLNDTEIFQMPQKAMSFGLEFFGNYELIDSDGKTIFSIDNYYKAKFILYANRQKPASTHIPNDLNKIISAVKEYERLIDSILREIERSYKVEFPEGKMTHRVTANIFSSLNLQRY